MSYFGTKLALFMIASCGLVLGQSDNRQANDPYRIHFPRIGISNTDNIKRPTESSRSQDDDDKVPMGGIQFAQQLNSIESYEEFLKFVKEDMKIHIADNNSIRSGRIGNNDERSSAVRPKPALCTPELQSVPLSNENKSSVFYYPTCTRIQRCGGCCNHDLLTCEPIAKEIRNFLVHVMELGEDSQMRHVGTEIVPLEEHTKCKCDCKVKAEHCNKKQVYEKRECKCVCTNTDEEDKCRANNDIKLWDSRFCTCNCREIEECSTGFYFNHNTCRCQGISTIPKIDNLSTNVRYSVGQTQRSKSVPTDIVPLDASDPRRKPKDDPEY